MIILHFQRKHYQRAVSLRGVIVADPYISPLIGKFVFIRGGEILFFFFCLGNYTGLLTGV